MNKTSAIVRYLPLISPAGPLSVGLSLRRKNAFREHCSTRRKTLTVNANVGDLFSKGLKEFFGSKESTGAMERLEQTDFFFSDNAPSWNELETLVKTKAADLGDLSFTQDDYLEVGSPNPLSLKRTFGKDEPIRVKLYRDHAAWCPYCQKVWIQLEEKQIPYVIEKINMRCYGDKPESFYRISSSGLLPVMEFDGKIYTESAVIASLLEREFPEMPLLPPESIHSIGMQFLSEHAFRFQQWLCQDWNNARQKATFESVVNDVETALQETAADGPYFLGKDFSLVDIVFAPFLERMDASLAYYKGYQMRKSYPNLEKWFEAMETRPTYIATRTDYYTHAHALPPQLGGCAMTKAGIPFATRIDGLSDNAWKLPLEPLSPTSFEPYSPGEDPSQDTYYAAKKLVMNHEAVVKFALRGCGEEGAQPVMAPLSDPTAQPGLDAFQGTDASLRHVAHSLLVGVNTKQEDNSSQVLVSSEESNGSISGRNVIPALRYIRDRIGVPRDLKLPQARQLRAHINWIIDTFC